MYACASVHITAVGTYAYVCFHVCIHMCVCVRPLCTYKSACVHVSVGVHECVYECARLAMCKGVHLCAFKCARVCVKVCMRGCMSTCVCARMHVR